MSTRGAARINDKTIGTCRIHGPNIGGRIIEASADVKVNGRGVARIGDKVQADCGHTATIITSSPSGDVNDRDIARLNDKVGDSPYTGKISTASDDTALNSN